MTANQILNVALVFIVVCLLTIMLMILFLGGESPSVRQARHRLRNNNQHGRRSAPGWQRLVQILFANYSANSLMTLSDSNHASKDDSRARLLKAGYFRSDAIIYFGIINAAAVLICLGVGIGVGYWLKSSQSVMLGGAIGTCLGLLGPRIVLGYQVKERQRAITNALPDAIDMLVLCIDGGTSFQAALQRVCEDIETVHPTLAIELKIVLREMQLGLNAGESLMKLANRCAISDIKDLGLIVVQSEKFGASLSKTLRTHAETSRIQRQQKNEEQAQKTALKILFPTMLCIFPAIFVIVLGPAVYQTAGMFGKQ